MRWIFFSAEPIPRQLVKAERLPQLLQRPVQADVGFVVLFRQASPFLVGRALTDMWGYSLVKANGETSGTNGGELLSLELPQSIINLI